MNIGQTDSLLQLFAQTASADESERVMSALLTEHAEPVISKIIRYKTRGATDDAEEIYGAVMLQLVGRLQRLREEKNGRSIDDFNSYVAVTTYNACDRFLSRKYPQRRRKNRARAAARSALEGVERRNRLFGGDCGRQIPRRRGKRKIDRHKLETVETSAARHDVFVAGDGNAQRRH